MDKQEKGGMNRKVNLKQLFKINRMKILKKAEKIPPLFLKEIN